MEELQAQTSMRPSFKLQLELSPVCRGLYLPLGGGSGAATLNLTPLYKNMQADSSGKFRGSDCGKTTLNVLRRSMISMIIALIMLTNSK